ncbi:vasoactive intestinal polypeptide receptor 2 isoform X2 [Eptesicus fuscus]|uniref:vasoactive intestinal polypeptide receptor 2 isoform X2 n=1 Tax=Eptesicus fuscus TaxID=29078 RepID=UPI002404115D|nr:vasoactive intestinal polypeptide receptor 2 isoform X2 [Eptesicus fuscus]
MRAPALLPPALLTCCGWLLAPVSSVHPECQVHLEMQEEEAKCADLLMAQPGTHKACSGAWDNLTCWRPADLGETVTVPCPPVFKVFSSLHSKPGNISKNCTSDGWSQTFPDFMDACGYRDPEDRSQVGCKLSLVLFQYCVTANFSWLLVEGLYLHTLLAASFSRGRRFQAYLLIGWGIPAGCTAAWAVARLCLEDTGCWDTNEHSGPWWVIRTPILISILVNFILFVSILRILLQKLTSPDARGSEQPQYRRLTKSTLLLIPLFGIHYMVFAVLPTGTSSRFQLLFELCAGSFQGLVVAVLYCFLNSDVQNELRRKWQSLCPRQLSGRGDRLHSLSISRNGSESTLPSHRGSHSPSFLQTETSVI